MPGNNAVRPGLHGRRFSCLFRPSRSTKLRLAEAILLMQDASRAAMARLCCQSPRTILDVRPACLRAASHAKALGLAGALSVPEMQTALSMPPAKSSMAGWTKRAPGRDLPKLAAECICCTEPQMARCLNIERVILGASPAACEHASCPTRRREERHLIPDSRMALPLPGASRLTLPYR
jgi:hypothetical protein